MTDKPTVLVVDDNEDLLDTFSMILILLNYDWALWIRRFPLYTERKIHSTSLFSA